MRRVALASLLIAGLAHANGRPPRTIGIYPQPGAPDTYYVATTFGLLKTTDAGCTMLWMCEDNLGYAGTWDPHYVIGSDGTIFATTDNNGLRVSRDGGCTFESVTAALPMSDPNRIADLWIDALEMGPTGEVWVGTSETAHTNDVFVSLDNGVTFSSRGMQSPEIWWKSVKVAPSNPATVYITGYKVAPAPTAYAFRSTNGGMDWTPLPLTNVMFGSTPVLRIKEIDPVNPDVVYMASEGASVPGDRLYRSSDGGQTWTEALMAPSSIHDIVIRDAQNILIATQLKDPTSNAITGGPAFRSTNGGMSFEPFATAPNELTCLAQRADRTLFACAPNWMPDSSPYKAVAKSTDDGATWDKVWRFVEMADAVQCGDGTVQHDKCDVAQWDCPTCATDLRRQFGVKGPTCGVYATDPPIAPPKKDGCCDASGSASSGLVWLLVVGGLLTRRRRS